MKPTLNKILAIACLALYSASAAVGCEMCNKERQMLQERTTFGGATNQPATADASAQVGTVVRPGRGGSRTTAGEATAPAPATGNNTDSGRGSRVR